MSKEPFEIEFIELIEGDPTPKDDPDAVYELDLGSSDLQKSPDAQRSSEELKSSGQSTDQPQKANLVVAALKQRLDSVYTARDDQPELNRDPELDVGDPETRRIINVAVKYWNQQHVGNAFAEIAKTRKANQRRSEMKLN